MQKTLLHIKNFIAKNPTGVVVITGPTASGKTGFSVEIAKQLENTEIINCDSRQVYTHMPIITAAPTKQEKQNIPHHLFEFLSPEKTLNVMEWRDMAEEKILEIQERKNFPILCGGTGLWINALTKNFSVGVPPNKNFRKKMEKFSGQELWKILEKKDPQEAKKIPPQNKKYIIRALEICEAKGQKTTAAQMLTPKFPSLIIAVTHPRQKLYDRINARNTIMYEAGMLEEVKNLLQKYDVIYEKVMPNADNLGPKLPETDGAFIAHGVPEIIKYFDHQISLEEVQEKMKQHTRNYAKRQMTWWRKEKNIFWVDMKTWEENIDILSGEY